MHDTKPAVELLRNLLTCFVIAVTIIVVAVPEGLPMMVTVSLAMNMMKMARENCLVRKLIASETIGSATVICSDKTGTLTQNKMQPVWFLFGMKTHRRGELDAFVQTPEWKRLIDAISINSEANLHLGGGKVTGIGNPTESALLTLLHEQNIDYRDHRDKYHRDWELNHNSRRKMSLVFVEHKNGHTCHIKGAPERIIERCSTVLIDGKPEPIEPHLSRLYAGIREASEQALRVIGFSERHQDGHCVTEDDQEACLNRRDNTLLGLIGIADPIRKEVPAAVAVCQDAGIQVKMITGDALPTAVAIARQAGIIEAQRSEIRAQSENCGDENNSAPCAPHSALSALPLLQRTVVTSEEFAQVTDEQLPDFAENLRVLARSTPLDKLRLVRALHRKGEVVAMTGDGTNDAPALKFADVGLSMGISGTEVAKEASDIVLIDDNFRSIVTGVRWGRTLYRNIQRFLLFQLSVNVVALLSALIGPLAGVPLPFTVTQLLWINIIMDTFAAIALSTDPPRAHTMREKPISRRAHIITGEMGITILINGLYQVTILFTALYHGWFLDDGHRFQFFHDPKEPKNLEALTVFFTIFVMFQFWHKFNCRALRHDESPFALLHKNHLFLIIVTLITLTQIVMVQASHYFGIGEIFRTVPLSFRQWFGMTLMTATIIPVAWMARIAAYCLSHKGQCPHTKHET
ncbi:MAG: cation-translocating P-type ATPase [Planctomycetaceae bacterium]|nr:cation-translocating P-type ATPase [Planctomycetaceae bacterium]